MAHFRKHSHKPNGGGAAVIDLGAEREQRRRPQTAATDVAVIIHLEETALILAAGVASLVTAPPADGDSGPTVLLRHAYAALRGVLKDLGQRQGCPHAPFPELLDDRLCCVEASDGKTSAFNRVVDDYCEGDPSVALWLLDRLRRLDPQLGIPTGKAPGSWTRKQRATAVS